MLELRTSPNSWEPPDLDKEVVSQLIDKMTPVPEESHEKLLFLQKWPYIDSLYVNYKCNDGSEEVQTERFVFHDDYTWTAQKERLFACLCLDNPNCSYKYGAIDEIYEYYNRLHPDWYLKRYYTDSIRVLDHIYHCMRKNSVKELLYKCGLNGLARFSGELDDLNLLAASPYEIYGNVPMRILKALNCDTGSMMLCHAKYRDLFKSLGNRYPDVFSQPLNDAQCEYIRYLYNRDLTPKEIGRIYLPRRKELSWMWHPRQFRDFLCKIRGEEAVFKLSVIDPIYGKTLKLGEDDRIAEIEFYLLRARETYDRKVRVSNRKRDYDWQERGNGYVVRYPQTINDFCREAVYMGNCLLGYVDAFVNNATTIMFIRREDDVNTPFITLEVQNGVLMQAYHRFNVDCTTDEAEWIKKYCIRHGIISDRFRFLRELDLEE